MFGKLRYKIKETIKDMKFYLFPQKFSYDIQLETTNICNAKCVFCPNPTLKRKKMAISDEVFTKVIDRIKNEKIKVKSFALHINGEPLADKKIFERVRRLKYEFPNTAVRFTSNFSLATDETILEMLDSGLDEITISLNSIIPDEYEKIMGLKYSKVIENVEKLFEFKGKNENNLNVGFSIVARAENKNEVENFKRKWSKYGYVRVIKLGGWVDKDLSEGYEKSEHNGKGYCSTVYSTINILSNGDYALCCFDAEGIMGQNVMTTPILKFFTRGKIAKIRRLQRKGILLEECKNCSFM